MRKNVYHTERKTIQNIMIKTEFKDIDMKLLSKDNTDEIVKYIFIPGRVDNKIWIDVTAIMSVFCKLSEDDIIDIIGKYTMDVSSILSNIKNADQNIGNVDIVSLINLAKRNGYKLSPDIADCLFQKNGTKHFSVGECF